MKSLNSLAIAAFVLFAGVTSGMTAPLTDSASAPSAAEPSLGVETHSGSLEFAAALIYERDNQTNILRVPETELEATRTEAVSISVGHAIANDDAGTRVEYAIEQFKTRFEQAETAAARRTVIQESVSDLDARIAAMQLKSQSARARFITGGDGQRYLWTLGNLHARATALDRYAVLIRKEAGDVPDTSAETEVAVLQDSLERFKGPVRRHVADVVRGDAPTARVYVATGQESVALATVTDDSYLREAYLASARQRSGALNITTVSGASGQVEDAYPWAWANQRSLTVSSTPLVGKYAFELGTPQGTLQLAVDSRTGEVYTEEQTQSLSTAYLESTQTSNGGIQLRVHRTYGSGPVRVQAVDQQTETPVDAVVMINGQAIGSTGADGTLWTVAPHTVNSVQIETADGGDEVSVLY